MFSTHLAGSYKRVYKKAAFLSSIRNIFGWSKRRKRFYRPVQAKKVQKSIREVSYFHLQVINIRKTSFVAYEIAGNLSSMENIFYNGLRIHGSERYLVVSQLLSWPLGWTVWAEATKPGRFSDLRITATSVSRYLSYTEAHILSTDCMYRTMVQKINCLEFQ